LQVEGENDEGGKESSPNESSIINTESLFKNQNRTHIRDEIEREKV